MDPAAATTSSPTTLDRVKTVVEILAIVAAGGWALFEYGYKAREERLEGWNLRRISVTLSANAAQADPERFLALGQLKLRNDSKREVTTFLTSWWWSGVEADGSLSTSSIENSTFAYDLAPGEESLVSHRFVLPANYRTVVLHAHVFLNGDSDDYTCRLAEPPPAGGVEAMEDQPRVCVGKSKEHGCATPIRGCPSQAAEQLVVLKRASEKGDRDGEGNAGRGRDSVAHR